MPAFSLARLTDADLIIRTKHAADSERQATTELIVLLAELDSRRLYLSEGCSSLFTYSTQVLRLSESSAYGRITAARTARRFPKVLDLLVTGNITLTTVSLLSGHLTDENHEALLDASRGKSKRDVERLVASLVAQPDIPSAVRRLPALRSVAQPAAGFALFEPSKPAVAAANVAPSSALELTARSSGPTRVAPVAADRYLLRVTLTGDTHRKLERARSLLRHVDPSGDIAAIIDRALTLLVSELERTRLAATKRPTREPARSAPRSQHRLAVRSRYVPATIRRAVWSRDSGQCAFVGREGRCRETSFLEFHHVTPYAVGGATSQENLQLRCRAHNQFEAMKFVDRRSSSAESTDQR
jgi:hypothetical protein